MIVQCASCQTKFRVPDEKIGDKPVKVRCSKCQSVFGVKRGGDGQAEVAPLPAKPGVTLPPGTAAPLEPGLSATPTQKPVDPFAAFGPPPEQRPEETTKAGVWHAGIAATRPFDGNAATVGNGVMVGLEAKDTQQVDRLYAIALANGGSDEGPPGDRGGGFYAGYFRDPDGNKLNAFVMGAE